MKDAIATWKSYHRLFFLLIDGVTVALRRFGQAYKSGDLAEAEWFLLAAADLLSGSAVAMQLAGSFARADYPEVIASMPEGFSGLDGSNHQVLVATCRGLKPIFENLPKQLAFAHRQFGFALSAAIKAHVHVCEKFGGNERPSLLAAQTAASGDQSHGAKKTGVEILSTISANRLNTVVPARCPFQH